MAAERNNLPRVFIIDPSPVVRGRLMASINDVAHVIGQAASARVAIEGIRASRPHLAVLDVVIVNGFQLLRQIKTLEQPPVVAVLTHGVEDANRQRCLALGADHFLDKLREFGEVRNIVAAMRGTARPH
jgi:two-component system, OmpR family, response regulator